ncbi:uncharacterized protein TNCV_3388491 [Trichonephila clavipes]|nr:uncharacterized protein TNCV_3388491 [Trichonephila clavipes]
MIKYVSKSCQTSAASYSAANTIARHGKLFQEGKFLKEAWLACTPSLFDDFDNKYKIIQRIKDIPLSRNTIKDRILKLEENVTDQQKKDINSAPFISLRLDESIDITKSARLAVFARYWVGNVIKEELIAITSLLTTTKGTDICTAVRNSLAENDIDLKKIVSVTTDGAPNMRTALILKLAAKSERRWQVIAPDALPPTRVNLERSTEDVPETSKTDIQLETENHVSPPAGCEVTASTNADLTTIDPVELSVGRMDKSGLADDIVTGQLLDTKTYSVNNNINTDSTDEKDQDPFHNSDDDEVNPDYNTSNSGFESDSKSKDEPATGIEIKNVNEPITRKRKRGKFNKRTLAKNMRNCGEKYESKTRGRVNKRSMKPPCPNCKIKCAEKIDENYRKAIFAMFWGMGDLQRQREFIKIVHRQLYQRITLNRKVERGSNQSYPITKDGEKIRVCKQFFKNSFDLSDRAIRTTFEKTDKSTDVLSLEIRGKHGNDRKLDQVLVKSAKVHIEKIPRIPSHYCRPPSSREYIDGGKFIAELHRDYLKERKESNMAGISYSQYRAIFKSYNLSFFTPKKDQCDVCLIYQNTKQYTTEYENHILEKDLS